jgi:hypothetical protein
MIDSIIASNHHYYVLFFESEKIKTLSSIGKLFDVRNDFQITTVGKNKDLEFCHMQLEIEKRYGSEAVLLFNLSRKKTGSFYWYDFYIGKIDISGMRYFFVCYPYNRLGKFLQDSFQNKSIQTTFYRPELETILEYIRGRNVKGLSKIEKQGFVADITKYSAEVKERDDKANRINISGENPLKSKTFDILRSADEISVETVSLKLRCKQLEIGEVELSFDRLGNYRFWLKRNAQKVNVPVIPFAFKFLMEIAPLQQTNFISTNTLLESENE